MSAAVPALQELSPEQFPHLQPLFTPALGHVPLLGALDGLHPALIFVNDPAQPTLGLVASQWGYFYLGGQPGNPAHTAALSDLITRHLLPQLLERGQRGFVLWPAVPAWFDHLAALLPGRPVARIYRRTFAFDSITFYENRFSRPSLPAGLRLRPIDAALLDEMEDDLAAEIRSTWRSLEDYLQRGAGACLTAENGSRLASVCFAAFVAGGAAEANIFTPAPYRRKGLATLAAAAFVEEALRRSLRPSWECFSDNLPSLKLAENLGFKAQGDVPVGYWEEERSGGTNFGSAAPL